VILCHAASWLVIANLFISPINQKCATVSLYSGKADYLENHKYQIPKFKWFDWLTILSEVEGQIAMTKTQNTKPV